jgi:hypothetical protein
MNSLFAKKEILAILSNVAKEVNVDETTLVQSFNKCLVTYINQLGVPITDEIHEELKGCSCAEPGCSKKVNKPKPINGFVYCSVHLKQKIKDAKKNRDQCLHVYTEQSEKNGQQCTGHAVLGTDFCKRHQKKIKKGELSRSTSNESVISNVSTTEDESYEESEDHVSICHFDNSCIASLNI